MLKSSTKVQLQTMPYNSLTIGDLLGHGGYGDVYKATWYATNVAVKQLHLKTLPDHLKEEFDREAQTMAQCQFEHIVRLYGVCTEIGHYGLVMEYLPKGSLYGVLQNRNEALSWDTRWTIAIDIGKGLSYLHSKDILHRDLKSLNILLTENYLAKICDFGLSKIKLETSSSSTKSKTGTIRWRAPETFKRGFKPANSMDIYSYGMVLWEIASRELPFADASDEVTAGIWIKDGEKENIPTDCPKAYGEIIQETWQEAEKRPTAEKIVTNLTNAKPLPSLIPNRFLLTLEKTEKPYVEKSWHFDPMTERKAALDNTSPYQLLEATEKDKQKAISYYQHHPVPGYEIGSVKVIYNKTFNQKFNLQLETLQQKYNNPGFTPKWDKENNAPWRAETNKKLEELAKPYTDNEYPAVKILPLWHGTNPAILDSLFKTGYANLASTDSGFFGKGLYGAHEAEYSHCVYGKGALILNWVATFSAYPVIDGDINKLAEKGNYQNYDAHFVPITPKDPNDKNEVNYYPCKPNQKNTYTELVTFESSSCLPRYLVELQSNKPQPGIGEPSNNTTPKPQEPIKIPAESSKIVIENPEQKQKEQELNLKEQQLKELEEKLKQQELAFKEKEKKASLAALPQHGFFPSKIEIPKIELKPIPQQPMPLQAPKDETTKKDVAALLKWAAEGHLLEVEKLLKKNSCLSLMTGTVTDLSDRTFKNITVFQYAVWALDIDMWNMVLKYLDKKSALSQLQSLETNHTNYSPHGAHYDITPLVTKTKTYLDNCSKWDHDKCCQYWQKEVGGAQRQCPAWLIYAWCEKGSDVAWVKKDLTNIHVKRQYEEGHLKWWFTEEYAGGIGGWGPRLSVERGGYGF